MYLCNPLHIHMQGYSVPLWHPIHCLMAYLSTRPTYRGWGFRASKSISELLVDCLLDSQTTHPTLKYLFLSCWWTAYWTAGLPIPP